MRHFLTPTSIRDSGLGAGAFDQRTINTKRRPEVGAVALTEAASLRGTPFLPKTMGLVKMTDITPPVDGLCMRIMLFPK